VEGKQLEDQRIFISDCEGPISKNDNAFELATNYIPDGDKFFTLISKYDDVIADIAKKPGYKAGDTLKLILPFLKAYGVTNEKIIEYSTKHVLLVPSAKETMQFIKKIMPSFIVSTSYEQYLSSLCKLIGFPYENVYCTRLDMDKFDMNEKEVDRLKELSVELSALPLIEIPEGADKVNDLSLRDQKTLGRLNEIFWIELLGMKSGRMLEEVCPVGGYEKAKAVQDIVKRLNNRLYNVFYVGDSITDVSPLQLVKGNGGLTVSFNGNKYAVREAEIAVLSSNTIVTMILAYTFKNYGKEATIKLTKEWSLPTIKKYVKHDLDFGYTPLKYLELAPEKLPQVELINDENRERLSKESSAFRKTVRGENIGRLG